MDRFCFNLQAELRWGIVATVTGLVGAPWRDERRGHVDLAQTRTFVYPSLASIPLQVSPTMRLGTSNRNEKMYTDALRFST